MRARSIDRAAANARAFWRYVGGLRSFLKSPVAPADARARVARSLGEREDSFLRILRRAVYDRRESPYRRLFEHLGIELGDVQGLVGERGLEGALAVLHEAGAYVTLEEFKGAAPIRRAGLELETHTDDFDNPLLVRDFETGSGGSRGAARRISVDFDLFAHEAGHNAMFLKAFGLEDRPLAVWFPVPPGHAGINAVLRYAKLGRPPDRWLSHYRWGLRAGSLKFVLFTGYAVYGSRLWDMPLPKPDHVPLEAAAEVARWLAAQRALGTPALLETNTSSGVRICLAARAHGHDISGSFLRLGGESYTQGKAAVVAETGARGASHYSMGEIGRVANACATPHAPDDCHLMTEKLAAIRRPRAAPAAVGGVAALYFTTLLPSTPKLMLNVESGDSATLERRPCGCAFGQAGFTTHLHSIGSYEKLTTEGMNFLGPELIALLDEVLPSRFGGAPTDYQLVESQDGPLSRVEIVVGPRLGDVDDSEVISTVLGFLAARGEGQRLMADRWREAETLRVARREPHATGAGKILPLHLAAG